MKVKPYKTYLPIALNQPIFTDLQGELMTIEEQAGRLVIYFDANSKYYHKYNIYLVETGKEVELDISAVYLKTLILFDGNFVFHVYVEEIENEL
jgi:hypothetical protein